MQRARIVQAFLLVFLMAPSIGLADNGLTLAVERGATGSSWEKLPKGVAFEPITAGTIADLQAASELVSIARINAEPNSGVLSFYNDNPGMVGPRLLFVEEGTLRSGPLTVSPGSSPGPTLLIGPTDLEDAPATPKVVLLRTELDLQPGDLIFFPADTAYKASNYEHAPATYLEVSVFPRFVQQPGLVVEGMTAQPLAIDVGMRPPILPHRRS